MGYIPAKRYDPESKFQKLDQVVESDTLFLPLELSTFHESEFVHPCYSRKWWPTCSAITHILSSILSCILSLLYDGSQHEVPLLTYCLSNNVDLEPLELSRLKSCTWLWTLSSQSGRSPVHLHWNCVSPTINLPSHGDDDDDAFWSLECTLLRVLSEQS